MRICLGSLDAQVFLQYDYLIQELNGREAFLVFHIACKILTFCRAVWKVKGGLGPSDIAICSLVSTRRSWELG